MTLMSMDDSRNIPGYEDRLGDWMYVNSGVRYFPCDPHVEDVNIQDIAHHLSRAPRFSGSLEEIYSVAEHSYLCSFMGPDDEALERLLHDAAEAYLGDLIRPLKRLKELYEPYRKIEERNEFIISRRFQLEYPFPPSVKEADEAFGKYESDFVGNRLGYNNPPVPLKPPHPGASIRFIPAPAMTRLFVSRFNELMEKRS